MATAFASTLRALEAKGVGGFGVLVGAAFALGVGWAAWLATGSIGVYAVSDRARVEVDQTAHPVAPVVSGMIVDNKLALGLEVRAGDELAAIDATAERLQLAQERARLQMNESSVSAARKELAAEREGASLQLQSALAAREVARARAETAKLLGEAAHRQDEIVQRLKAAQLTSGSDALRSTTTAAQQLAEANQARLELQRVVSEQSTSMMDRQIRAIRLEREIALLDGQIGTSRAIIEALEFELARRTVRAPITGVIAEVAPSPKGTTVTAGQRLATVVPPGRVRVVAEYAPGEAVGRVRPARSAVIRLDGFPWTQYGVHRAVVSQVASEARDNTVRVELRVPEPNERLPLAHGLTGRVEVEVEQVTPLTMLVRSLGYWISTPNPATPPRESSRGPNAALER